MTRPLRILIADDSRTDRTILAAIIREEGHQVLQAGDGDEAISQYVAEQPDLILMDAMMPGRDGMAAARVIKPLVGDDLVPIIFLTALQDAPSLAECLESGGDDFLLKPYHPLILQAKIRAYGRMIEMHAALQDNHHQLLLEQSVARKVYDTVIQGSADADQYLRTSLSSKALFNGDTVLAQHRPDGGLHVFLGDFTGHGLPAAIGTMPLAETFYGMTQKGFELEEIVREMNRKFMRVLPVHLFCCAACLHLDLRQKMGRLWMGGLPDAFLLQQDRSIVPLASSNLPLGIRQHSDWPLAVHEFPMQDGERLFLWSDGILEAHNADDELFGESRLRAVFAAAHTPDAVFTDLLAAVRRFQDKAGPHDDATLVEARMAPPLEAAEATRAVETPGASAGTEAAAVAQEWQVEFVFAAATLRQRNPIPTIMHTLSETDGLSPWTSRLYTIISELYSNALEHGLLRLDSELKRSSSGFSAYYQQRTQRLEALVEGRILVRLQQRPTPQGGTLTVRVEDSGAGFEVDVDTEPATEDSPQRRLRGRGLDLVRQLCSRVEYLGRGNIVEVDFTWPCQGPAQSRDDRR